MKNPFQGSDLLVGIQRWNATFPFDFLFRQKYNIPFGSPTHRAMCFFDIKQDIEEEKYIMYAVSVKKFGDEYEQQLLKIKVTDKSEEMKQFEKEFDDINLDDFDNMEV